jgi:hypothetical protein
MDQAEAGQMRAIESSMKSVDRAMWAAGQAQKRIDRKQADRAY